MSALRRESNPLLGVLAGVAAATFTILIVAAIVGVRGGAVFERFGTTLLGASALYLGAGVVGGAVVGLLLPITVWRAGSAVVGVLAAVPLYLGIAIVLPETDMWSGLIAAVVIGGLVGYGLWSPPKDLPEGT